MTTIVLADDHQIVRQGLRSLLEAEPDFKVVGETGDGLQAVQMVEQLKPDVLVLDLMMGGINGMEVTRQVVKVSPKTNVIILSMHSNEAYVLEALQAGAKAYVLKESSLDDLVEAVRKASSGKRFLSTSLSDRAIEIYAQKLHAGAVDPYDTLTTREREVLHLAAQGCSNAEIAARLYISRRTVEVHRTKMMQKLGLHTRTDLVRYALQRGIVPKEE